MGHRNVYRYIVLTCRLGKAVFVWSSLPHQRCLVMPLGRALALPVPCGTSPTPPSLPGLGAGKLQLLPLSWLSLSLSCQAPNLGACAGNPGDSGPGRGQERATQHFHAPCSQLCHFPQPHRPKGQLLCEGGCSLTAS